MDLNFTGWLSALILTVYAMPEFYKILKHKKVHLSTWTVILLTAGLLLRFVYVFTYVPDVIIQFGIAMAVLELWILWYYIIFPGGFGSKK